MAVIDLTSENFKSTIASGVSLVKFGAPWCGPCRQMAPIIEKLATDFDGKANICDVNIDISPELAQEYGIRSVPTTIIFEDGKTIDIITGMTAADALILRINNILGD